MSRRQESPHWSVFIAPRVLCYWEAEDAVRAKEAKPMNNSRRVASGYSFCRSHAFLDSITLGKYCNTSEVRATCWFDDAVRDLLCVVLLVPGGGVVRGVDILGAHPNICNRTEHN